jgi:hypothetical protein
MLAKTPPNDISIIFYIPRGMPLLLPIHPLDASLLTKEIQFILELINLLAWLALTRQTFDFHLFALDDEILPILNKVVLVFSPHEYFIPRIHVRDTKYYSTHVTWYYTSTSSIKFVLMENLILSCLVNLISTSLFTHPN